MSAGDVFAEVVCWLIGVLDIVVYRIAYIVVLCEDVFKGDEK